MIPFILDNYQQHPWIWSLELLPMWDGYARMKSQAHWQSDVIAGWLLVEILPGGVSVGFHKRF